MDDEANFRFSSYREHVLEHQLIGEILRDLWLRRACAVEVLRAEVDARGYDVVLEYQSVVRHIQLKATRVDGKRASVGVNIKLRDKPSGCVIWFHFAQDTMRPIGPFRWLGGPPGKRLPDRGKKLGRHTKGDSTGHKAPRENIREARFITVGRSAAGKVVVVVHVERDERARIISTRLATSAERKRYESKIDQTR